MIHVSKLEHVEQSSMRGPAHVSLYPQAACSSECAHLSQKDLVALLKPFDAHVGGIITFEVFNCMGLNMY